MTARKIVLIILALAITAGTAIFVRNWVNNQQPQVVEATTPAKPKGPMVLVAQVDVPTGVFLQPTHLRWSEWPDDVIPESYYTDDVFTLEDLTGAVVRRGFTAGEPITRKRVIRPGDRGFLAAVLRPGYRAMALRIDATSSISGLVFPGDRVDLILTHTVNTQKVSETVLENVRILGIDQFIDEADGNPRIGKNATLEITPKQAEMLAVIAELGNVNLSLRSLVKDDDELERLADMEDPLSDPDPERGETFTFASEVSNVLSPPIAAVAEEPKPAPAAAAKPAASKTVNVTRGADTSVLKF
jgi:pilus assembly protein CpaB